MKILEIRIGIPVMTLIENAEAEAISAAVKYRCKVLFSFNGVEYSISFKDMTNCIKSNEKD